MGVHFANVNARPHLFCVFGVLIYDIYRFATLIALAYRRTDVRCLLRGRRLLWTAVRRGGKTYPKPVLDLGVPCPHT